MKKLITLILAFCLLTAADAQRGHPQKRGKKMTVSISVNPYAKHFYAPKKMQRAILFINRKYNRKIRQVQNNFFMRPIVKRRKVYRLNQQRRFEINKIKMSFYAFRFKQKPFWF